MARPFYDPEDPLAQRREVDDKRFGVDHFFRKLLRITEQLHTETARTMAESRHGFLEAFLAQLADVETEHVHDRAVHQDEAALRLHF